MQSRPVEVAGCLLAHFSKDVAGPRHRNDNARLIALAPDLARLAVAAGELAETHKALLRMMDDALKGTGKGDMAITPDHRLTLIDAWKRDAAFRAIAEGRE
jgi:hypothetical protein